MASNGLLITAGLGVGVVLYILFLVATKLKEKHDMRVINEKRRKNSMRHQEIISDHDITGRVTIFGIDELEKATSKFDKTLIVGRGGHGIVYKGILSDQRVVAIKGLNLDKITDDRDIINNEVKQFLNEVVILCQLNHRNVVKLLGCCLESDYPLIVYEFISSGTLTKHLHVGEGGQSLSWNDRLRIALETARALCYLHSAASILVFHRDIKTSNILLTDGLATKLSDFGASKSIQIDETGVSTIVQGTLGYWDPEYLQSGRLTDKSDVYSFSIILIELLTRKMPTFFAGINSGNIKKQFISAMSESSLLDVLDTQLLEEEHISELESVVAQLAEVCVRMTGEERPTMKEVEMRLDLLWRSKFRVGRKLNDQNVEKQRSLIERQQSEGGSSWAYSNEVELTEG